MVRATLSHSIHSQLAALFIINDIDVNKSANEIDSNVILRNRHAVHSLRIGLNADELIENMFSDGTAEHAERPRTDIIIDAEKLVYHMFLKISCSLLGFFLSLVLLASSTRFVIFVYTST